MSDERLLRCKHCSETADNIWEVDTVYTAYSVTIEVDQAGVVKAEADGALSETFWDSCEFVEYQCRNCDATDKDIAALVEVVA